MATKHAKPTPVVVTEVCSMCGLDWQRHGDKPTTEDCIRLLKAELASRPVAVPFTVRPWWDYPQVTWTSPTTTVYSTKTHTPALPEITCHAVSSS